MQDKAQAIQHVQLYRQIIDTIHTTHFVRKNRKLIPYLVSSNNVRILQADLHRNSELFYHCIQRAQCA